MTLKLDKTVIDSAKKYAKENKRSLSKIVENYFTNLAAEHIHRGMYSAIVESLSGILSDSDLEKFAREKNGQISCSES